MCSVVRVSIMVLVCCAQLLATPIESKSTEPTSNVFVGAGALLAFQQDLNPNFITHSALSVSARGGYQHRFFYPNIVRFVRLYLDYTMSVRPKGIESITTSMFLVNSDVVSYFYTLGSVHFGLFTGLGLGIATYGKEVQEDPSALDSVLAKGFSAAINAGMSVLIASIHRLELGVKFPITKLELTPAWHYRDTHLLVMYDYMF